MEKGCAGMGMIEQGQTQAAILKNVTDEISDKGFVFITSLANFTASKRI